MSQLENSKQPIANKILNKLRNTEPTLTNAGQLTESIMNAIADDASRSAGRVVSMIYRTLVAASIALVMAFCVEEYIFLDKIKTLESKASEIAKISEHKAVLNKLLPFNAGLQSEIVFNIVNKGFNDAERTPLGIKLKMARFNALDIRLLNLPGNSKMRDVVSGRSRGSLNN